VWTLDELLAHLRFDGECLRWVGPENGSGYGFILWKGKRWLIHRLIWHLAGLPLPEGMVLDHSCHIRDCISYKHLELVTLAENSRRKDAEKFQVWISKWAEIKIWKKANYCCDKHHMQLA
jgi:hypothetical protein